MTTEAEFRAKADARVIEAMAETFYAEGLSAFMGFPFPWSGAPAGAKETARHCAHAALDAYRATIWMPMSEAPKDVHILVSTNDAHGLPPFTTIVKHHPDGGFCVDELREPIACQPLPLPPTEEPK